MNQETLKALRGSIKKWERIVAGKLGDYGNENCDLCKKFWSWEGGIHGTAFCNTECPIKIKTGKDTCSGTPHIVWCEYLTENKYQIHHNKVFDEKSKQLALDELNFLKSLLPKEKE